MNITVIFAEYDAYRLRDRNPEPEFSWSKSFVSKQKDEAMFEQALGYMIGIDAFRPKTAILRINNNGKIQRYSDFQTRSYFIGAKDELPKVNQPLTNYLTPHQAYWFTKRYLLVYSKHADTRVYLIQFNHLTFLQGLLSIFRGFHMGTQDYIISIYDRNGTEYTVRY